MSGPKQPESKVTTVTKPESTVVPCVLTMDNLKLIATIIGRTQFQGSERGALYELDVALQKQVDELQKHSNVTKLPTAG